MGVVLGDQIAPGSAELDDAVGALEGGAGAGAVGGVLDEEAGNASTEGKCLSVCTGSGTQGVQGGGVAIVDKGAFRVVRKVAEYVPEVEDGQCVECCLERSPLRGADRPSGPAGDRHSTLAA